ncbi:ABC transporter substrate-binding protein [Streptosporangium sp. NBC_01755]|uniref:ABC transporter substrate-binding protein n=1 Tax=unclassified Streptosporangium TaxID=2632669 RepID=UPI002DDB26CC|nr:MULTISPECIES: ABC transporter substrate-binding protein [unclassified Streptosporangium]WSA28304.1 ABC transporter substrate-binding protein [Streptosporangium sp. NBC_01810]WSD00218.1 ABC transporter substrate-binding protein [Streptosporangium sp. NBC_01755]
MLYRGSLRDTGTAGRRVLIGLCGVMAATVLAGCGGADPASPPAAVSGEGPSGTLRFGTNQRLDDWETITKQNATYTALVYEGLLSLAKDGFTIAPQLATGWKESGREVTFTLREGVFFHDGTPFDADAVVKNLERVRSTPSAYRGDLEEITSVTATSPTEVVIKLKRPAPSLLTNLARLGTYMVSPKALDDGSWKTNPSGTGPWKFDPKGSVRGQKAVLTYFDKYYDPKSVGAAKVQVTYINDADSLYNALRTGQMDVVWTTPTLAAKAETEGLKSEWFPSVLWHPEMFDTVNTFKEKKLRQAMCYALNPKDYIDAVLGGKGNVHLQRFSEGQPGFNPDVPGYPFDLIKAKQLMQELGNPKVSFTLISWDTQRPIAELFRSQLAQIGIDVKLEVPTFPQFLSTYESGKYPLAILSDGSRAGVDDYYNKKFAPDASGNPFKVKYPEITAAVEEGLNAETPEARDVAWRKVTKIVYDEALDCGYFDYTAFWAYNPKKVGNIVSTNNDVAVFRYKEAQVKE